MAVAVRQQDGSLTDPLDIEREWRQRISQGKAARQPNEAVWQSNLAFAAGKHWLEYDRFSRQLRHISEIDPRYADEDLYTADVITEHRAAALGELQSDDDRPELLIPDNGRESETDEQVQAQANRAVAHGWDYEWMGDQALLDARRKCIDLGVSAVRCRFDPTAGPPLMEQVPHIDGKPLFGDAARVALQNGPNPQVEMRTIHEGRIRWQVGSAFQLITPPGVVHERDFPWEVWVAPEWLDTVKEEYGDAAADLREDGDIGSALGVSASEAASFNSTQTDTQAARLRGHVWVYTCYQRPTVRFPKGRVVVLASNQMRLLHVADELPYQSPDGTYRSGIAYFHFWRRTDSFWSRAFVEALKDPQRMINRRKTQNVNIIDRGMPFILIEEDTLPQGRQGVPVEFVKLKKGTSIQPTVHGGIGPGPWMYQDVEALREDLSHASTMSPLRLGENPANIDTYSQLALLNETEQVKREPILFEHKLTIKQLVEDSVYDIRRYWGHEKQILVAGEDNRVQAELFDATKVPMFFVVNVAKGAAKPRSQAAELKKVEVIWDAAVASGAQVSNPDAWVSWLKDSMEAGQPLDLPEAPANSEQQYAQLENHLMRQGAEPTVADYHLMPVHVPEHRELQNEALMSGDVETFMRVERHVQQHIAVTQENAAKVAAAQGAPSPHPGPTPQLPPPQLPPPAVASTGP